MMDHRVAHVRMILLFREHCSYPVAGLTLHRREMKITVKNATTRSTLFKR